MAKLDGFWNDVDGFSIKDAISIAVIGVTVLIPLTVVIMHYCNKPVSGAVIELYDIFINLAYIVLAGYFLQEGLPLIKEITDRKFSRNRTGVVGSKGGEISSEKSPPK
jgi:hypothetical protein